MLGKIVVVVVIFRSQMEIIAAMEQLDLFQGFLEV